MTLKFRTIVSDVIPEGVTVSISAQLVDELGVGIALSSLTTLTLTLYDRSSDNIINSRNLTDIKNLNGGTVSTTGGIVTYELTPLDNVILDPSNSEEDHVILLQWTYSSGSKSGKHEIVITVANLNKVT